VQSAQSKTKNFLALGYRNRKSKIKNPKWFHRITLSALARTLGGIVRPICFAVFKLITSSNGLQLRHSRPSSVP
jgi:hypothetical protein